MHTRHSRSSFRVGRQRWRRVGGLLSSRMAKGSSARVTRRGSYDFTALAPAPPAMKSGLQLDGTPSPRLPMSLVEHNLLRNFVMPNLAVMEPRYIAAD